MKPTPPQRNTGKQIHRRQWLLQILLPFVLMIVFVVGLLVLLFVPQDGNFAVRIETLANLFSIVCLICPTLILFLVLYIILVVMNVGMSWLHQGTEKPLIRLENLTTKMREQVQSVTSNVDENARKVRTTIEPLIQSVQEKIKIEEQETSNE
jgi:nitrogen fixation/metabolism regulation signal transduction histidine kinase